MIASERLKVNVSTGIKKYINDVFWFCVASNLQHKNTSRMGCDFVLQNIYTLY